MTLVEARTIAERLGLPQDAVRKVQRHGFLRQLDLDEHEIRQRLWRGHLAHTHAKAPPTMREPTAARPDERRMRTRWAASRTIGHMEKPSRLVDVEVLIREIQRYLAVVDAFRAAGCNPGTRRKEKE